MKNPLKLQQVKKRKKAVVLKMVKMMKGLVDDKLDCLYQLT